MTETPSLLILSSSAHLSLDSRELEYIYIPMHQVSVYDSVVSNLIKRVIIACGKK